MANWSDTAPHPWRRCVARVLDTAINGSLALFAFGLLLALAVPDDAVRILSSLGSSRIAEAVITCAAAMPINAALVAWTGGSFGKWLLGVRVLDRNRAPIGLAQAFQREVWVWFEGLALGIPLIAPVTAFLAFRTLNRTGATNWDAERQLVVVHRPPGPGQVIGSVVGGLMATGLLVALALLSLRIVWDG